MDKTDEFEEAFQTITSVVLGEKLTGYRDYETWLSRHVSAMEKTKSAISENVVYLPPFDFYKAIKSRVVTIEEGYDELGKGQLSEAEVEALSLSNAHGILKDISITTPDTQYGVSSNMVECAMYYHSHTCFRGSALNRSKCSLYSFWPRQSDYTLGCYYVFSSQFCIKCYNSENLIRCFEVSDSNNCSDCYFCHNCDNLSNCMFCFNVKAKRYAIANVEVGKEKYNEIKKRILGEIVGKLRKDKNFGLSIYDIGSGN